MCAEFSGSAGEAPTGIKVGVEALSKRPQGGGDGSWPFSSRVNPAPTPVRHGLRGKPYLLPCFSAVPSSGGALKPVQPSENSGDPAPGGVPCSTFQNEGPGPKAWGERVSRQEGLFGRR